VRVDADDLGVLADELVELIGVADRDVFVGEYLREQRFDDAQTLRDLLGLTIRP